MPTIEQIRAARALLGWNQHDLADKAGLSQTGIARIENGTNQPNSKTISKIETAFDQADVEFIDTSGVKKRANEVRILEGKVGFIEFMNDVYKIAKEQGGQVCLHSANPENWYKWMGKENYEAHAERMIALGDHIDVRITCEEGNFLFVGNSFAEYRWFPGHIFKERSFYSYGDRLAFLSFFEDNVIIQVIKNKAFSEGFRVLFNVGWDKVAVKPKNND